MSIEQRLYWDCRWPDPVAMKVAAERILADLSSERTDLNRRLQVTVRLETAASSQFLTQALLVTPWAVERVYWSAPSVESPPVESAVPLERDERGKPVPGQGVLLMTDQGKRPVVIAWEPETGLYFVETLLSPVPGVTTPEEAMAVATGARPPPSPRKPISEHLNVEVSRRSLFKLFR